MEVNRGVKRKKKSFLSKAKKHGRKGSFGRGTNIEHDDYQYFLRVLESMNQGFDTDEEKADFARNVLREAEGREVNLSCNQLVSRVMEGLAGWSDPETLGRLTSALGHDLRKLFEDRFGSHVAQAALRVASEKAKTSPESGSGDFVLKCARFSLNNLEGFLDDPYANHVLRTVLESLVVLRDSVGGGKDDGEGGGGPREEAEALVKEFAGRALGWDLLAEYAYSELQSGFLQSLLAGLAGVSATTVLKKLLGRILSECFVDASPRPTTAEVKDDEDSAEVKREEEERGTDGDGPKKGEEIADSAGDLPGVFQTMPSTRLLETAIEVAPPKKLTQIYAMVFINRLRRLSLGRNSNLTVQKLLRAVKEKCEFEAMYEEIVPGLEAIIRLGHTGVVYELARACQRFRVKQGDFLSALMKAHRCSEGEESEKEFAIRVLEKKKKNWRFVEPQGAEEEGRERMEVDLHGSLTLQTLLEFNKPIKVVNSLLSTDPKVLLQVFSDPKGSHVSDAFLRSEYVGEKSREKLVYKMKGSYVELASGKYGSRSLEALWSRASGKARSAIAAELLRGEPRLRGGGGAFGSIVASKLGLGLLRRDPKAWEREFLRADLEKKKKNKEEELFREIVGSAPPTTADA